MSWHDQTIYMYIVTFWKCISYLESGTKVSKLCHNSENAYWVSLWRWTRSCWSWG